MKIVAITLIALSVTLLITFGAIEVLLTLYRLDFDPQVTKELFICGVSAVYVFFYHWCWKKSL